jgi:hypothetical protein
MIRTSCDMENVLAMNIINIYKTCTEPYIYFSWKSFRSYVSRPVISSFMTYYRVLTWVTRRVILLQQWLLIPSEKLSPTLCWWSSLLENVLAMNIINIYKTCTEPYIYFSWKSFRTTQHEIKNVNISVSTKWKKRTPPTTAQITTDMSSFS